MGHVTTEQDTSCLPEPLTRKNADGEVYCRQAAVDRQIQTALGLDSGELRTRSEVTDKASPDFLKEEALVYLIRHYHRAADQGCVNFLSEALLRRCATWISHQLHSLDNEAAEEGYSDVVTRLFERILDLDSDRGDFLQVRFWMVLKKLAVDVFDRQLRQLTRGRDSIPLTTIAGHDGEDDKAATRGARLRTPGALATRAAESEAIERTEIREALSQLDEPLRSAFLLRHFVGLPIEDQDPAVHTISRRFGKTPRTIRNWLARAGKCLAMWRGGQG